MPYYKNHLGQGYIIKEFKDKRVVSSLNSLKFQLRMDTFDLKNSFIGIIPPGYEHRADKIAELFYGSPSFDWLVMWTNDISDPFEQLNIGDRIRIISL
jgi:hypothetical protein